MNGEASFARSGWLAIIRAWKDCEQVPNDQGSLKRTSGLCGGEKSTLPGALRKLYLLMSPRPSLETAERCD